jgi:excisionase family DNA binding protein
MAQLEPRNAGEKPFARTIEDTAQHVKCGRTTIYAAIKSGALKARKIGRHTIILDQDLREWLASLPMRQAVQPANLKTRASRIV